MRGEEWLFAANVLNLAGIAFSALPPLWVGWLQWHAMRWRPKTVSAAEVGPEDSGIDDLKMIISDFFREAAGRVRPWHLVLVGVGILLNAGSAVVKVVISYPS